MIERLPLSDDEKAKLSVNCLRDVTPDSEFFFPV
jgi:hypothetical protein